jgi:uncharacterized protein YdeI (YjbR/CyaY-like superfamily)
MNPDVEFFFANDGTWQKAYRTLRQVVLKTGLTEELKWGCPCYTHEGANIVLIHGFKEYCALLFMKGALLKDDDKVLIQQTKNVQSARQLRFRSDAEVRAQSARIQAYVKEAIAVETAGLKVKRKTTADHEMPEEFQAALQKDRALNTAFWALTPGRQRGYLFYFSQAKQSKTRVSRIDKSIPRILEGFGVDD